MAKKDTRPMSVSRPDLAVDFHPTKNGKLTAEDFVAGTGKRIWWKCSKCSHEWPDTGNNRVRGRSCIYCKRGGLHSDGRNSFASKFPEIVKEIHPTKNQPIDPWRIAVSSNKYVHWKCNTCSNEYPAMIAKRTDRGQGCGYCNGGRLHSDGRNSIANSTLIVDFDFTKNTGIDPNIIVIGSNVVIDWKCKECSHEWSISPQNRIQRREGVISWSGCGACSGYKLHSEKTNSLQALHPELADELHESKNEGLDPRGILPGSSKRVWWRCSKCSNEWNCFVINRTRDNDGCGYCNAGRMHSDGRNSLARVSPELVREFDIESNHPLTPADITYASPTYVTWKCIECGHTWNQSPKTRFRGGTGCSVCAPTGIDLSKPGQYYVIKIMNRGRTILYKGGISNNYRRRFSQHTFNFKDHPRSSRWELELEEVHHFQVCSVARDLEKRLLKEEIKAPKIRGLSSELFLSNPLEHARNMGWIS